MLAKCFQRAVTSNLPIIKYRVLRRLFYRNLFINTTRYKALLFNDHLTLATV